MKTANSTPASRAPHPILVAAFWRKKLRHAAEAKQGGGTFFATFPGGANIFSRNLTPDITGLPEGGHTLDEFKTILRTGHDYDNAHPPCPATGAEGCILGPPVTPINANVLQIMPWATYGQMSDNDIAAIYEYRPL